MEEVERPRRGGTGRGLGDVTSALGGMASRWNGWVEWFGLGRLVASAVAVLVVCGGAFWLVRTPPPPTEAMLPRAASPGSSPVAATLPPPVPAPTSETPSTPPARVTVHVAGAVQSPGVYALPSSGRVADAIDAAGGATADGRPDELNLAAVLVDGSRIHVPIEGEPAVPMTAPKPADGVDDAVVSGPIDVNRATAAALQSLPGVGPATAAAIVAERERNGPFLTVDDLERVSGVGPGKVAALRDLVTL